MIGRLDQLIEIEQRAESVSDAGGREFIWRTIPGGRGKIWARVTQTGATEVDRPSGEVARQSAEFTVRRGEAIDASDRILWDGRAWDVEGVIDQGQRARYKTILASAGQLAR